MMNISREMHKDYGVQFLIAVADKPQFKAGVLKNNLGEILFFPEDNDYYLLFNQLKWTTTLTCKEMSTNFDHNFRLADALNKIEKLTDLLEVGVLKTVEYSNGEFVVTDGDVNLVSFLLPLTSEEEILTTNLEVLESTNISGMVKDTYGVFLTLMYLRLAKGFNHLKIQIEDDPDTIDGLFTSFYDLDNEGKFICSDTFDLYSNEDGELLPVINRTFYENSEVLNTTTLLRAYYQLEVSHRDRTNAQKNIDYATAAYEKAYNDSSIAKAVKAEFERIGNIINTNL